MSDPHQGLRKLADEAGVEFRVCSSCHIQLIGKRTVDFWPTTMRYRLSDAKSGHKATPGGIYNAISLAGRTLIDDKPAPKEAALSCTVLTADLHAVLRLVSVPLCDMSQPTRYSIYRLVSAVCKDSDHE